MFLGARKVCNCWRKSLFFGFFWFFFLGAVFPQPHRCFLCRFYWFLKGISFMLVLFLLLSLWFTLYTYLWTWLQTIVYLAFFRYILLICLSKTYAKPLETTQNSNSTPKKSFLSNFSYLYTSPLVASLMGKNECFPKKIVVTRCYPVLHQICHPWDNTPMLKCNPSWELGGLKWIWCISIVEFGFPTKVLFGIGLRVLVWWVKLEAGWSGMTSIKPVSAGMKV